MAHPSKTKGTRYERELVTQAKRAGLTAERAPGSNGRALGHTETVDLIVAGIKMQAKRRKTLPAYLTIPKGADVTVFRADHHESMVLMPWQVFLEWLKKG